MPFDAYSVRLEIERFSYEWQAVAAQLVELQIVVLAVVGSSPIVHPNGAHPGKRSHSRMASLYLDKIESKGLLSKWELARCA